MGKSKAFMCKFLFIGLLFFISATSFAKSIELEVMAKKIDVNNEQSSDELLILNGFRQAITAEVLELNLDSQLFWEKLDQLKMPSKDESLYLNAFFQNISMKQAPTEEASLLLKGVMKADIDIEKLKRSYAEITTDLGSMRKKTFYLLANIELDSTISWSEVTGSSETGFIGAIKDSWKKLVTTSFKSYENVEFIDKDFLVKPDYMNSKSVTLKWKSTLKKVATNNDRHVADFELQAQYILVKSKTNDILLSFDYPIQKRQFDFSDKKKLSSNLASMIYSLLLSQSTKINTLLENYSKDSEQVEISIKFLTKTGLSELNQINALLVDRFKDMKLSSQIKTYSPSEGPELVIRAEGDENKILDRLSLDGGIFPLNEQKVLYFNRLDKSFAILPKDSNNKK